MLLRLPASNEPHTGRALFLSCSGDGTATVRQAILGTLENLNVTIFLSGQPRENLADDVLTEWNLISMERSDVIGVWVTGDDSLLEVGLWAKSGKLVVGCSKSAPSRALLEITCERYSVTLCADVEEFIALLRVRLADVSSPGA